MKSWDPTWETVFKKQEWGKYPGESLIQFIARNFYKKERKNISLLEIGCGPGANIWFMAREGFSVTGIDGSQTAINQAQERLQTEQLSARLIVGDILKLPFNDLEFDGIIDVECLYSNNETNTLSMLSEINKVLKPNGLFYSRTFSKSMFIGNAISKNEFEFHNVNDGPLFGKGFIRLIDEQKISSLYGRFFKIQSVDKLQYTINNGIMMISEYIIVCQKK
jgi:ubiquinone/menaquinone biosynthesis C-methylase UbiE